MCMADADDMEMMSTCTCHACGHVAHISRGHMCVRDAASRPSSAAVVERLVTLLRARGIPIDTS